MKSCIRAVEHTKESMSCTKMNFTDELIEAYQQTIDLFYDLGFKNFYESPGVQKDLSGPKDFMASVRHAVEVNKEKVVDMRTFQLNFKLFCVATQKRNLPLPPCKQIIPLSHPKLEQSKAGK